MVRGWGLGSPGACGPAVLVERGGGGGLPPPRQGRKVDIVGGTGGTFRRRIVLDCDGGTVRAGLEDDFHHFRVRVTLAENRVSNVEVQTFRFPWTTCPGAAGPLRAFIGMEVAAGMLRRPDAPPPRLNCTHLHDLTLLALAQAARGPGRRQYDVTVPPREPNGRPIGPDNIPVWPPGRTRASLTRDGVLLMQFDMEGETVRAPLDAAGLDFRHLGKWAAQKGDDDFLEAVKVFRQGFFVSSGRAVPVELVDHDLVRQVMTGVCYTFQPERIDTGERRLDTLRDFTHCPDALLADF